MADPKVNIGPDEFSKLSLQEQAAYLRVHTDSLNDPQYGGVYQSAYVKANGSWEAAGASVDEIRKQGEAQIKKLAQTQVNAATLAAQSGGVAPVNQDLNQDGTVSAAEKAQVEAEVKKTVSPDAQADVLSQFSGLLAAGEQTPEWLFGYKSPTPGTADPNSLLPAASGLSDQDKKALVDEWNSQHPNSRDQIHIGVKGGKMDWTEFYQKFTTSNPETQQVADSVFLGQEPQIEHVIRTGDGREVRLSADQMGTQLAAIGLDTRTLTNVIRTASRSGILAEAGGKIAWQPLAALLKASGMAGPQNTPRPGFTATPASTSRASTAIAMANQPVGASPLSRLGLKYNEGLTLYGRDPALGYLHALDPGLAARVVATTGGTGLSTGDRARAQQLFIDGGFDAKTMQQLGYAAFGDTVSTIVGDGFLSQKAKLEAEAKAKLDGSLGPVKQIYKVDASKAVGLVTDMYRAWFQKEPPKDLVENFRKNYENKLNSGGRSGQTNTTIDVDPTSLLRTMLMGDPEYKSLFGNKPGGVSEEDFVNQAKSGVTDILGTVAVPDAVRAGMKTGNQNTAIGFAAGTRAATQSSRFMGRLAAAAQIFNENT